MIKLALNSTIPISPNIDVLRTPACGCGGETKHKLRRKNHALKTSQAKHAYQRLKFRSNLTRQIHRMSAVKLKMISFSTMCAKLKTLNANGSLKNENRLLSFVGKMMDLN